MQRAFEILASQAVRSRLGWLADIIMCHITCKAVGTKMSGCMMISKGPVSRGKYRISTHTHTHIEHRTIALAIATINKLTVQQSTRHAMTRMTPDTPMIIQFQYGRSNCDEVATVGGSGVRVDKNS